MNHYDRHAAVGTRVFCCPLQYQAVIGDCLTSIEEVGHMSDTELLPKPKREAEPVRRLGEVFTGAGRRRRWTAEQKARIVAERRAARRYARCAPARVDAAAAIRMAPGYGWRKTGTARAALHLRLCDRDRGSSSVVRSALRRFGLRPGPMSPRCRRCCAR
jgi:transposase-like protein